MKRLLMHVGLGKTGTSTIQATLAANRRGLATAGVVYPGAAEAHHDLVALIHQAGPDHYWFANRNIPAAQARAAAQMQLDAIAAAAADSAPTILLSSELFQTLKPAALAAFDAQVAAMGCRLETLVYIREPYGLFASFLQEMPKQATLSLDAVLERGYRPWAQQHLRSAARALGKDRVHLRRMEDAIPDGLTRDVLRTAGLTPEDGTFTDLRRNTGLSRPAVYLMDALNKADDASGRLRRQHLKRLLPMDGPRYTLPPDIAAHIAPGVEAEQDWIARHFGLAPYLAPDGFEGPTHADLRVWADAELPNFLSRTPPGVRGWLRR